MSRGVLINTLNTYIGTALYQEFLGEDPEDREYLLFGTYYEKDDSTRPKYVKKMMKRSKPGLFRKYILEQMDTLVYDLHTGRLDDLEWLITALTREPLESEKTLVVISSVLSWGGNDHYMVEDKPEEEYDEDGNLIVRDEDGIIIEQADNQPDEPKEEEAEEDENIEEGEDEEVQEEEGEEGEKSNSQVEDEQQDQVEDGKKKRRKKKKKKKNEEKPKEVKYKRIGFSEEEYEKRIPVESYKKYKEYEDYLLNLNVENLNIYVICAGIPYGNCETVFNHFFKSAWLQSPEALPYFNEGANLIPTIHVKDLAKIVKRLVDASQKPECHYVFAFDETTDKTMLNLVQSISRGVGTGLTGSEPKCEEWSKDLNFLPQDFYIDPAQQENIYMCITNNELNWRGFLGVDIMLKPSSFIDEEFEWHCKGGIPANIPTLSAEFAKFRKLRPLKIVLNCIDKDVLDCYSKLISKIFNIPIINFDAITERLECDRAEMGEEEAFMADKYLFLKERLDFLDKNPEFPNEENLLFYDKTEITYEVVKLLLTENASTNRGYILAGMPINLEEVNLLYNKKEEIVPEEGEEEPQEEEEEEEYEVVEEEEKEEAENKIDNEADKESEIRQSEDDEGAQESHESIKAEKEPEEDEVAKEEQPNNDPEKKRRKKKKKVKPKKYKKVFDKKLLPESVISINFPDEINDEIDNIFWEVENFFQDKNIEVLNLLFDEDKEETFEKMRIYIERNSRPFNYFKETDEDINQKRMNYLTNKTQEAEKRKEVAQKEQFEREKQKDDEFWHRIEEQIEKIEKDKQELEGQSDVSTRKFLLLNIMPTLSKGMLEVCKINPIDPIDYLANSLFDFSTD